MHVLLVSVDKCKKLALPEFNDTFLVSKPFSIICLITVKFVKKVQKLPDLFNIKAKTYLENRDNFRLLMSEAYLRH